MITIKRILMLLVMVLTSISIAFSIPAFPGAEGYGAGTRGAYGNSGNQNPAVYKVSDTTSFKNALKASGSRIITFSKGGTFDFGGGDVYVNNPYLTVAGQTAPGGGVCIKNGSLRLATNNIIIRGLRWRDGRPGGDSENHDCISIENNSTEPKNIIIDHCSLSWGSDEIAVSWFAANHITWQWNMIYEGLNVQDHAYGLLVGDNSKDVSVHHNLFAHLKMRMPECNGGTRGEITNNVMYHWTSHATDFTDASQQGRIVQYWNVKKNFYIQKIGEEEKNGVKIFVLPGGWNGEYYVTTDSRFYIEGNIDQNRTSNTEDEWDVVGFVTNNNLKPYSSTFSQYRSATPVVNPTGTDAIKDTSAEYAYNAVLDKAGAIVPQRDSRDIRIINDVKNRTGNIINSVSSGDYPSLASGSAPADSDVDGIPDDFEQRYGGSIKPHDKAPSGYTWIEEYINGCFPGSIFASANPDNITADGINSAAITAEVRNECDSLVTSNIPVTFTITGPGTFNGSKIYSTNTVNGIATATLKSTESGISTITVTSANMKGYTIYVPISIYGLECSANPTNLIANGTSKTTITATIKDKTGEIYNTNQQVTFTVSGPGTFPATPYKVNAVNGVATAEMTSTNTEGTAVVTASFEGAIPVTININTVYVGPPAVAEWHFDEGIGTTAVDASGNNNTGTLNGTEWIAGKIGSNALQFDGVDDYVSVPASAGLNIRNAVSLEAWINTDDVTADNQATRRIIEKGKYALGASDKVYFKLFIGGSAQELYRAWDISNKGIWYHIVGTYDSAGGTNNMKFYINGELVTASTVSGTIDDSSASTLLIGMRSADSGRFKGKIDEAKVFNRALTAGEVKMHYTNTTPSQQDTPPTVNITAPTNNSVVSGIVTISGTANDAEGGVVSVAFYIDNVLKNTDTTAPYEYSLDTTQYSNGTHTIKAIATDTIAQTSVAQITVTIDNTVPPPPPIDNPPQVALVVPTNNSVVSGIVTISGTANDDNGISKVCFYIDDVIKSTDTTAPYAYTLDTTQYSNGTHTIKLIATDTIAQTAVAQITVTIDNAVPPPPPVDNPPTVLITSPGDNDTISGNTAINVTASDDNGILKVCFYVDNIIKSTDTATPYTYNLDTTQYTNGTHTIKVIATDTISQITITQIIITIDNIATDNPPQVALVVPNNNSVVSEVVAIEGTATDDNGISKVCFYIDNVIKSTDTTTPYTYNLDTTQYTNGTHIIKIVATDTANQTATTQRTITVNNIVVDNPPTINITAPANNSVVSEVVAIEGTATDAEGGISKVCFYIDNVIKSTDTTAPYAYTLDTTQYTNGTHIIKAVATDTIAQTASTQITVTINNIGISLVPKVDYLSITKLERAELQLSWLAPIDANEITAYNIYMSTGEMDYTTVYKTVASTQTQVIISGLIANQEYKFVLRSVDTNGNEEKNTYIIADTAVEHVINGMGVVKVPQNGMDISGKKITLISESIDGDISNIKDITFEYRRSGDDNWITISVANPNHPNPDNTYPYFINWDVSELNSSYLYNVRAVATDKNGIRDTRTGYVTVGLDNEDPDIEETSNYKRERIDNRRQNEIIMGEPNIDQICKVNVPDGVLSSSSTMIKIVINPMVSQTIGKSLELANGGNLILIGYIHNIYLESGQDKFSKEIEISLPYQDDNKDNRVDGTNIGSNRLIICSFDELIGKWQKVNGSTIDKVNKLVTCKTNHLSYYGVFAVLQSDLNTAHIYPNPYKPSIGHTSIIFTNLTNRTKAQIFNLAGDVVYEQEKDTPTGELSWDVKNAEGEPIASGVYMYMITNNAGQVKKGKLAIIR